MPSVPYISVVIPTLNEREHISRVLACANAPGVERIVVDGGSQDGTLERARESGVEQVVCTRPGRAHQMDQGYRAAKGEVVMFLHADSILPEGWSRLVVRALENEQVVAGAFGLRFESARPVYRFLEFGARWRVRMGGFPYGDQAFFLQKKLLEREGGIADVPIFEDLDLVRLARRHGRMLLLRESVMTSPRRYEANGPLRVWLRNTAALAAYGLGADRDRVARWYHRIPPR